MLLQNIAFPNCLLKIFCSINVHLKAKNRSLVISSHEEYTYTNKETGEICTSSLKCIAKSHPLFQEFRLWQFISNLRIYQKKGTINGKFTTDIDVTNQFLKTEDDYANLFDWLNQKKEIRQDTFLKKPAFGLKKNIANYRWNYVEDKTYPCNETHYKILSYWEKAGIEQSALTSEIEEKHGIFYTLFLTRMNSEKLYSISLIKTI